MHKLLIVCGPTATGKTKRALVLAREFNTELISADSRQIYKGFSALTGKDLPRNIKSQKSKIKFEYKGKQYQLPFYEVKGIKLWMYDVVLLDHEFSVAHYRALAEQVLADIWRRGKLPILVGGTGLYLSSLTQNLSTLQIPPDPKFRKVAWPIEKLQQKLKQLDKKKWESLNRSDRANPRRLVRAIEIYQWKKSHLALSATTKELDVLWLGLTAGKPILRQAIKKRVRRRFRQGLAEVKQLMRLKGIEKATGLGTILGLKPLQAFFNHELTYEEALTAWVVSEFNYAKRQLTWFKKQPKIHWFDISQPGVGRKVSYLTRTWYTKAQ